MRIVVIVTAWITLLIYGAWLVGKVLLWVDDQEPFDLISLARSAWPLTLPVLTILYTRRTKPTR
ncbi:MAG: hypothetical protein AAB834_06620 [Patescibacteria group bacterium]